MSRFDIALDKIKPIKKIIEKVKKKPSHTPKSVVPPHGQTAVQRVPWENPEVVQGLSVMIGETGICGGSTGIYGSMGLMGQTGISFGFLIHPIFINPLYILHPMQIPKALSLHNRKRHTTQTLNGTIPLV